MSSVEFTSRIRLMFVAKVTVKGRFTDVTGTLTVDENEPANSHATIRIGTASLDTKMAAGHYRITGNLTIREVTHEVSLDARDVSSKTPGEVNLQLTVQFVPASSID
jgi:polyisoprenoid-binding protein YceI